MSFELIIFFIMLIIIAVLSFVAPLLQSKNIFLGVRIPNILLDSDAISSFKKRYIITFSIVILLWVSTSGYLAYKYSFENIVFAIFFWFIIAYGVYIYFNKKVQKWKAEVLRNNPDLMDRQTAKIIDTSYRRERLTIKKKWYLIPFSLLLIQIIVNLMHYNKIMNIPNLFKTITSHVSISIFLVIMIVLQNYIIRNAKQNISAKKPEKSKQQNIIFRRRWSLFIFIALAVTLLCFLLLNFIKLNIIPWDYSQFEKVSVILAFIIVGGSFTLSILMGQSGSRIKIKQNETGSTYDDMDDDKHWKFGIFYYNPEDPAMFVEKRMGVGWTFNFANIKALLLVSIVVLIFILILVI
ncbi:MAG: DUF5808 domain-containing protein [Candidatus Marinimicrobia bacterium]|nr:DUF5808 domain-containing protein [Candidatus Neomarinimicrobiota bacterium]